MQQSPDMSGVPSDARPARQSAHEQRAEVEQLREEVSRLKEEAKRIAARAGKLLEVGTALSEAESVEEPSATDPFLSFQLAARVDFGHELKQELLEIRSERARLHRLAELLERAAEALVREREVRDRASGNGKVTRHSS